jgi:hypothetical protein
MRGRPRAARVTHGLAVSVGLAPSANNVTIVGCGDDTIAHLVRGDWAGEGR